MNFEQFNGLVQQQFKKLTATGKLFKSSLNGDTLWKMYLEGFTPDENPIFRDPNSSTMNGNNDKNFMRRYGSIVAIDENFDIITLFDNLAVEGTKYANTVARLSAALKVAPIQDVFFETFNELNSLPYESCRKSQEVFRLGIANNRKQYNKAEAEMYGVVKEGQIIQFHHFHMDLPKQFVKMENDSIESIIAKYRDAKNLFKKGVNLPVDTLELVRDLINQGSVINSESQVPKIEAYIKFCKEYQEIAASKRDNWAWVKSFELPIYRFANELIGTFCIDLAEGKELNITCQEYNKRADSANWQKAKAPWTERQKKEATKLIQEKGYEESFKRRYATADDLNIDEIKFANTEGEVKEASVFDALKSAVSTRHKRAEFDGVAEMSIEDFMAKVLPTATDLSVFLENTHESKLCALITAASKESKNMFKYTNNFSLTFANNLAGESFIKQEVRSKGGKVDGVLRFSIMWADGNGDNSDLDAHCKESAGDHIYFSNKVSHYTKGNLDIDIQRPEGRLAVENITYPELRHMKDGTYKFYVHQYAARNSRGFSAEIEFEGQTYTYVYDNAVKQEANIDIATVTLKNGVFSIVHHMPETTSSRTLWGLESGQFHKVSLMCLSPNYWGENNVGNKQYLFMLQGCKADIALRGYHIENLNSDLLAHRKVLEPLGEVLRVQPSDDKKQLCGLGFNATVKDSVILKVQGTHSRLIKVVF